MFRQTIILADTDPHTLDHFPRILSDHLPHVMVDICTSVEELCRKSGLASYDTMAMSLILLQAYRFLKYKAAQGSVAPILVTAGERDRTSAYRVLQRDALDFIAKPVVPHEAVHAVKQALWHNQLMKLLASRVRAIATFQDHMETYPRDFTAEPHLAAAYELVDRTLQMFKTSKRPLLSTEEEGNLFDTAASIQELTRKRALDRLLTLCNDSPSQ